MFLLGAAALVASQSAWALDACVDATIEEDPFDDHSTVTWEGRGYSIKLGKDGAVYELDIVKSGIMDMRLPAGFEMQWVLDNGTKVKLISNKSAESSGTAYATQYVAGTYTSWHVTFPITAEVAHAIAQSAPSVARYELVDEERTIDFDKGDAWEYQRGFACIANHIGTGTTE